MAAKQWLKDAIVKYVKDNSDKRLDSGDICSHMQLRVDITMLALYELEEERKLRRIENPAGAYYT